MANKLKVVIDTNVFIYGWFGDNEFCDKILDLIDNRKLQLLFAQDTIGELIYVTKNFVRHNLKNVSDRLNALQAITVLFYYGTSVNTMKTDYQKSSDSYDDMFLKCAIQGEADYLISDDIESGMHSNDIKKLGVKVVTSEEFIKIYEESTEASD